MVSTKSKISGINELTIQNFRENMKSFYHIIILCLIFFANIEPLFCQISLVDSSRNEVKGGKLAVVCGITGGAFIVGHVFLSNLWWKGEKSAFHFDVEHDWKYALGADKFGHFFFPYLSSNIYRQALDWTGMDSTSALYYSCGWALAYETYVEVKDGFSKEWGFSPGDFTADLLGASFPILQNKIPILQNFNWKISFYPSDKFKAGAYKAIIDDYESTTHWLTINVHNLSPNEMKQCFPAIINVAIGHSVRNLDLQGAGNHELYLSLDWNLNALPDGFWLLNVLKRNLNYYHLPAPAIRIYPNIQWIGLKF